MAIIYCDMDGVLADFKTAAVRTTGMSINKWMNISSSKEKWSLIKAKKDFWSTHYWKIWWQTIMVVYIKT